MVYGQLIVLGEISKGVENLKCAAYQRRRGRCMECCNSSVQRVTHMTLVGAVLLVTAREVPSSLPFPALKPLRCTAWQIVKNVLEFIMCQLLEKLFCEE